MDGEQIRAARALLRWTVPQLADASGVSVPTVQRLDSALGPVSARYETVEKVRDAFTAQGVRFLATGDVAHGPGVARLAPEGSA